MKSPRRNLEHGPAGHRPARVRRPWPQVACGFALAALLLAPSQARAQDAFFHRGAQHFLAGSNALAKVEVERGLQIHPDNDSLKKFWELLNQQQDSQDQKDDKDKDEKDQKDQKDKKDQQDQQKQDKQDPSKDQKDQQKDSQKQDQQQKDQQKQDQEKEKEKEKQQEQNSAKQQDKDKKDGEEGKAGQQPKPEENGENPEGQPQGQAMIRMTPQQAVQLLEALKSEERTLQFRPILRTNRNDQVRRKDW